MRQDTFDGVAGNHTTALANRLVDLVLVRRRYFLCFDERLGVHTFRTIVVSPNLNLALENAFFHFGFELFEPFFIYQLLLCLGSTRGHRTRF